MTRSRKRLLLILGFALSLRLAFVLRVPQAPIVNDAAEYDQEAHVLAFGNESGVQISKGPLYPMFLAALYRFFGHDQQAVRVVQALISSLSVLLIYAIGRAVFHERVGVIASALAAIYPPFISYSGWLLTETLSVFLLLALVYALIRAIHYSPRAARWMVAGVLGGLLALNREEMLVVVGLLALALWRLRISRRLLVAFVLAALATMLPWTVRNYVVFHELILVAPGGGAGLWISSYEAEWLEWHPENPHYQSLVAGLSPIEADRKLRREGIKNILSHPRVYLKLCLKRIPRFWLGGHSNTFVHLERSLGTYLAQRDYLKASIKLAMLAFNLGLIALGFAGVYLAWRLGVADPRHLTVMALPVLAKAGIHVFLFADLRYQVPIMSLLILFAAFTIWHVRRVVADLVPAHA